MANIERLTEDQEDREYAGDVYIDDDKVPVYWDFDLPVDQEKAAVCTQHLKEGTVADAQGEFVELGCKFPEAGEPQLIRYRIECPGSCDVGKCAVRIVQYDIDGNVID